MSLAAWRDRLLPPGEHDFPLRVGGLSRGQVDEALARLHEQVAVNDNLIAALSGVPRAFGAAEADNLDPEPEAIPESAPSAPSGRAGRRRQEEVRTGPRPRPFWGYDVGALAAYVIIGALLLGNLLTNPVRGYLSQGVQDQQAFEWYFSAAAHSLQTFSNPLISTLQNYPDGVNLMANAAMLGLGLPLAPVTWLLGAHWTFILIEWAGLSLTAFGWYWLFRRWLGVGPGTAFVGGLVGGFAPGMITHANGHPNFVFQALIPLIIDRVLRLAQPDRRPIRDGVVLGLLSAWQVLIGEEVLLLTAVGLVLVGLTYAAHGHLPLGRMLPGVAVALGVGGALVAYPLWWQFFGPQSYTRLAHVSSANDLAQLWGTATRTWGSDVWASAALSMNRTEENSFFGIGLWVLAAVVVAVLHRRPVVRASALVIVLCSWLSLGESVTLHGTPVLVPGIWGIAERLPVIENVLPTRLTLVAIPAFGALVALGLHRLWMWCSRARLEGALAVGLAGGLLACWALVGITPTALTVDDRPPVPTFFTSGEWETHLHGGSLLAVPPPTIADMRAVEWQLAAGSGFAVVEGYFVGPDGTAARTGQYGAVRRPLSLFLADIDATGTLQVPDEAQREQFRADLRAWRVDVIVLDERPHAEVLRTSLQSFLGEPTEVGGVSVWDARAFRDGKPASAP